MGRQRAVTRQWGPSLRRRRSSSPGWSGPPSHQHRPHQPHPVEGGRDRAVPHQCGLGFRTAAGQGSTGLPRTAAAPRTGPTFPHPADGQQLLDTLLADLRRKDSGSERGAANYNNRSAQPTHNHHMFRPCDPPPSPTPTHLGIDGLALGRARGPLLLTQVAPHQLGIPILAALQDSNRDGSVDQGDREECWFG